MLPKKNWMCDFFFSFILIIESTLYLLLKTKLLWCFTKIILFKTSILVVSLSFKISVSISTTLTHLNVLILLSKDLEFILIDKLQSYFSTKCITPHTLASKSRALPSHLHNTHIILLFSVLHFLLIAISSSHSRPPPLRHNITVK